MTRESPVDFFASCCFWFFFHLFLSLPLLFFFFKLDRYTHCLLHWYNPPPFPFTPPFLSAVRAESTGWWKLLFWGPLPVQPRNTSLLRQAISLVYASKNTGRPSRQSTSKNSHSLLQKSTQNIPVTFCPFLHFNKLILPRLFLFHTHLKRLPAWYVLRIIHPELNECIPGLICKEKICSYDSIFNRKKMIKPLDSLKCFLQLRQ